MREVTPVLGEDDEQEEGLPQGLTPSADSPSFDLGNPGGIEPSSGPVRSNEQRIARQLAARSLLHGYQKEALDDLVKASIPGQNVRIFVQLCSLENKLNKIISDAAPYTITAALKANIQSVVVAVLLSPKLSAYKGDIPKTKVLAIILAARLHIPSTYGQDVYVSNMIDAAIAEALTQARSNIKKSYWRLNQSQAQELRHGYEACQGHQVYSNGSFVWEDCNSAKSLRRGQWDVVLGQSRYSTCKDSFVS